MEEEDEEEEMEDKEFFPGDLSFSDEEEIDVGIEEEFLHPPLEHVINLFEEEEEQHQQEQQFNFGDLQDPAFPPNFIVPPPHLAAQPAHTQFTGEEGYNLMQHALAGILPPGIQNFSFLAHINFHYYLDPTNGNWWCHECAMALGIQGLWCYYLHQVALAPIIYRPNCPRCDMPIVTMQHITSCGICCMVYLSNFDTVNFGQAIDSGSTFWPIN